MSIFVNKTEISEDEIGREMQYHPATTQEQAWQMAARSLVIRQLLLQKAAESGLIPGADGALPAGQDEDAIDQLLQQEVAVPEADEETCLRFYDNHPDSFIDDGSGQRETFIQVKARIRDYLHTKAMRIAVAEYIKALSCQSKISGFEL